MLNQQNQAENDQALNNVGSGVKNAAQDGVGSTGRAARSGINYLRDKKGKGKEAKESDRASDKEGAESNSNRADNQKVQNEPRSQQSPQNQQKTAPKGSQNTTKVQNGPQGNKQQTGSTPTSSSVKKTGKVASSSIKGTKGAGEGAAKASTSSVRKKSHRPKPAPETAPEAGLSGMTRSCSAGPANTTALHIKKREIIISIEMFFTSPPRDLKHILNQSSFFIRTPNLLSITIT